MNQIDLVEEQRRFYPKLFSALDAVAPKLTLEQAVRLISAVTSTISWEQDVDDGAYSRAVFALYNSLDWPEALEADPERRDITDEAMKSFTDKLANLDMKKLTQDGDAPSEPGEEKN